MGGGGGLNPPTPNPPVGTPLRVFISHVAVQTVSHTVFNHVTLPVRSRLSVTPSDVILL